MKREYYQQHSDVLNENVSMIVYGEGGYPVIAFQAQDAKSNNFEDFGMIDALAPFIEEGRIQVFSVDNIDEESWSDRGGDNGARAWRQEEYFKFVTDELVPRVRAWNNSDRRPLAIGCSMGAMHAAIAAFRRPDLFQGCIALSGVYHTSFFFGDWMDANLYNNDVPAFLSNMPADHPYVDVYNQRQLVLCVGQGAWEEGINDLRIIDEQLDRLGVDHWCDFWGTDVNHDWPWWRRQMPYFMNEVLVDIEAQAAEAPQADEPKPAAKKPAAKRSSRKTTTTKAAASMASTTARKTTATKAATAKKTTAKATTAKAAASKAAASKSSSTKAAASKTTAAKASSAKASTTKATSTKTTAVAKKTTATKATAAKTTTASKAAASKGSSTKATASTASTSAKKATATRTRTTTRRSTKKADSAE